MPGQREDLVGLFDHVWDRFWRRMDGYFADATRRSFVLHIADELIHHTAEAALLRDLFAGASARS
jgi:hypothetical protein